MDNLRQNGRIKKMDFCNSKCGIKELIDTHSPWCCGQMAVTGDSCDAGSVQMNSMLSSASGTNIQSQFYSTLN